MERATRGQAASRLWCQYQAGRVTASKFKLAARTNAVKPSPSLVKAVCYPNHADLALKPQGMYNTAIQYINFRLMFCTILNVVIGLIFYFIYRWGFREE